MKRLITSLAVMIGSHLLPSGHTNVVPVVNEAPSAYTSPTQMKSEVILTNDVASVTVLDKVKWQSVAHCETQGNWSAHEGNRYQGGLGITPYNWIKFGGLFFAPHSYEATPVEQIFVAKKIQHGLPVPDQWGGCSAW